MPELHRDRLSEPLSTVYDSSLRFRCPRKMTSAVEKIAHELGMTSSDFLRIAVNHAVSLKLVDLEEDRRANLDKLVRAYQEELYEEEDRRIQEYEQKVTKFIMEIAKGRKLYKKDYAKLLRYKEYVEKTDAMEQPSSEELHSRWKKFCKTKRGRHILDEIEKKIEGE